jgi:hypothetical protein
MEMSYSTFGQVRKTSAAWIVHVVREFFRTIGSDLIEPID